MGIFSEWQPRYAEQGVSTFPITIDGKIKKPAIKGYAKVGLKASLQLSFKFYAIDALACMMGKRNGITVIDIDSPDEDLLRETLKQYGNTPLIIRTGSGGFHCYYTNAGEDRLIRPDPDIPVDQLGKGVLVLPPSIGGKNPYEIIRGRITDLNNLPFMSIGSLAQKLVQDVQQKRIVQGSRNKELFNHLMREARHVDTFDGLLDVARTFADDYFDCTTGHAFTDAEVMRVAKSVWKYEASGNNRFGQEKNMIVTHKLVLAHATQNPNAFALFSILQTHHKGIRDEFILSNATASSLGWTLRKFKAAVEYLVNAGLLRCVHQGGLGRYDAPMYKFC